MSVLPKIPDDIYENRCKYCRHHIIGKENREIKPHEVYLCSNNPCVCNIQSIARYNYQVHDERYERYECVPYADGECRSFTPNMGFPICENCEYGNPFSKDTEYCLGKPKNRKVAVVGMSYGAEYWKYAYMVCDNWKMSIVDRRGALERVAQGKLPPCFDPKTFKLLKPTETNKAAEQWEKIIEVEKERLAQIEAERIEKEKTDENGQYKMLLE